METVLGLKTLPLATQCQVHEHFEPQLLHFVNRKHYSNVILWLINHLPPLRYLFEINEIIMYEMLSKHSRRISYHSLVQDLTNFFCKGTYSKYIQLCRLSVLLCNYSTPPLQFKSSYKQHINQWAQLSKKTLFMKTDSGKYLAHRL